VRPNCSGGIKTVIVDASGFGIEWLSPEDKGTHAAVNIAMLHGVIESRSIALPIEFAAIDRLVIELLAIREAHSNA